jgi:hypothetical protein
MPIPPKYFCSLFTLPFSVSPRTAFLLFVFAITACLSAFAVQPAGYVDYIGTDSIIGWACDSASGSDNASLWIHFFEGGTYLGSTPSNSINRPDTNAFCPANTWVGFSMAMPRLSAGWHTISVYANNSIFASTENSLAGATQVYFPSADFTGPSPFGVLESVSPQSVSGWACDADSAAPITVDVYVQYDGVGQSYLLASGTAGNPREYIAACGSASRGFTITLPTIRGGQHNIFVTARNVGPGSNRLLEKYSTLPNLFDFPLTASFNPDPGLNYFSGCWELVHGASDPPLYSREVNCPTGMGPWLFSISKTVQPDNTIPEPQLGYAGPATRVRYDSLAGGGTVIKINTYDDSAHMTPWDYNFQAAQTNLAEIQLNTVSQLVLEVQLGVRNEQDFFFYDASLCGGGIESGNIPWIHTIVGSVFRSRTQDLTYFLEIVPFYREHQISNGCASPKFKVSEMAAVCLRGGAGLRCKS